MMNYYEECFLNGREKQLKIGLFLGCIVTGYIIKIFLITIK